MRKIAATYIFTPQNQFLKNGILICDDDGTIIDLLETGENIKEEDGLEYYSGILVPGFVNAHCHLELSYLKGRIEEKKGIENFLRQINQLRIERPENIDSLLQNTDRKMWANGIAATGDISNTPDTIEVKKKSKIYYHTFIESFGFHPSRAKRAFTLAKQLQYQFENNGLSNSITPHSAYSVSNPLFNRIADNSRLNKSLISIHNQETEAEIQFFKSDIDEIIKRRKPENTYFVICPNSNLYIGNQLPPVNLFKAEKVNFCIGTDSLASNHELSILSELRTLQNHFPEITLKELFIWACLNGANALGIENQFGSFEPNKKPGINLISGVDFKSMKLTSTTKVKRLC